MPMSSHVAHPKQNLSPQKKLQSRDWTIVYFLKKDDPLFVTTNLSKL